MRKYYNIAGDLLVTARKCMKQGDSESALLCAELALQLDEMDSLAKGMTAMNDYGIEKFTSANTEDDEDEILEDEIDKIEDSSEDFNEEEIIIDDDSDDEFDIDIEESDVDIDEDEIDLEESTDDIEIDLDDEDDELQLEESIDEELEEDEIEDENEEEVLEDIDESNTSTEKIDTKEVAKVVASLRKTLNVNKPSSLDRIRALASKADKPTKLSQRAKK